MADGPNLKLTNPWRGPYVVRSRLSPVIYRVSKGDKPEEMSVHLARIKRYYAPSTRSAPDFDALDGIFLGTKIPVPDFDNVQPQVRIKNLVINAIESHRRRYRKTVSDYFSVSLCLEIIRLVRELVATSTLFHGVFS